MNSETENFEARFLPLVVQGVLEEPPWWSLVCALRRYFSCSLASLVLRHSSESDWNGRATTDAGWDVAEWSRIFLPRFVKENLFPVENLQPGKVYPGEEITPFEKIVNTVFFREVLMPVHVERFLCICLGDPDGNRGWLYLARPNSIGQFKPEELDLCQRLVPALQTALRCYTQLMQRTIERDLYQEVLARMYIGTLILDEHLKVLRVDPVAEGIIQRSPILSISRNVLKITHSKSAAEFSSLYQHLLARGLYGQSRALRIPRNGHRDLHLLVRCVRPEIDYGSTSRNCLMLFINDPESGHSPPPRQLLSDLYGLTAAEALVASLMAQGMSIPEIAAHLELSEGTIRSHLKHTFSKLEVNRQAELVRVVNSTLQLLH